MLLKPAPDGTGIIAGGALRSRRVVRIQNMLTKSMDRRIPTTWCATFAGLKGLKDPMAVHLALEEQPGDLAAATDGDHGEEARREATREGRIKADSKPDWLRRDPGPSNQDGPQTD
jgi:hypothetical protein